MFGCLLLIPFLDFIIMCFLQMIILVTHEFIQWKRYPKFSIIVKLLWLWLKIYSTHTLNFSKVMVALVCQQLNVWLLSSSWYSAKFFVPSYATIEWVSLAQTLSYCWHGARFAYRSTYPTLSMGKGNAHIRLSHQYTILPIPCYLVNHLLIHLPTSW